MKLDEKWLVRSLALPYSEIICQHLVNQQNIMNNLLWYELLDQLIHRKGLSRSQVAYQSGVKTKTITSWLRGDVKSPRSWQPILHVLQVLNASTPEANLVLQGAGHHQVHHLAMYAEEVEYALLSTWLRPEVPFMSPDHLVANLVGRKAELERIVTAVNVWQRCVLVGMGGVGKTTLAIELAHQLRYEFSDGVFWGNLHLSTPDAVLESWGQAFGVDMSRLTDFNSRAAYLRGVFSQKKALLILDDVVDGRTALQMLPLQQSENGVLITTRSEDVANLLGQRQPERILFVKPIGRSHSLALLEDVLGETAVSAEVTMADELADLLGDLPLALQIGAALCADAHLSLAQMVDLLSDLRHRLEHLRFEQKPLVRLAFEQSWALLDEPMQNAFAALAVFGGRPFTNQQFATVLDMPAVPANLLLAHFCRRTLINRLQTKPTDEQLFQQHTLLAAFAAEKLPADGLAWRRFSEQFCQSMASENWWQTHPVETWSYHLAHLMAGMAVAHRLQDWSLLLAYKNGLEEMWRRKGLYSLARQGYAWAVEAAEAMNEPGAAANIRLQWGRACLEQSDYEPAKVQLTRALTLLIEQEEMAGVANAFYELSRIEMEQSHYEAAEEAIQHAYRAYQQVEDVVGMGRAFYRLGYIAYFRGENERAAALVTDALRIQQQADDKLGQLRSRRLASQALILLERVQEAEDHCRLAAQLVDMVDDLPETAAFYYTYADLLRQQQSFTESQRYAQKALVHFREMADSSSEANALLLLAGIEVFWNDAEPERQQYETGLAYCREGLNLAEAVGYEVGKAFLLLMNGRLLAQQGDTMAACTGWTQALKLAQALQHTWLQRRLQTLIDETDCAL